MVNWFTEVECQEYFRFTQSEIRQIMPYLGLDEIVYGHHRIHLWIWQERVQV